MVYCDNRVPANLLLHSPGSPNTIPASNPPKQFSSMVLGSLPLLKISGRILLSLSEQASSEPGQCLFFTNQIIKISLSKETATAKAITPKITPINGPPSEYHLAKVSII